MPARLCRVTTKPLSGDISDLQQAKAMRLEVDRSLPMSQRLARVHALCKQMSAIKGVAKYVD
jgi:hypothetical protein